MSPFSVITAVGRDGPGIVAGVSEALWRLGCNIEDSSMTLLRSEFAMILVVRRPAELAGASLEEALEGTAGRLGLRVACKELAAEEAQPEPRRGEGFLVSVYGADHPGIVYRVAAFLAERGINITDLSTRVVEGSGPPVYIMLLELDAPAEITEEALRAGLENVGSQIGVEVSVRPMEEQAL
jgi:glycine cleavage system transcriptional repressor